jgi:predicted ATP-grasp superfamily ATP-dependent carboligase
LDKLELFKIAKEHEIPVPATVVCNSIEDVAAQSARLRFPLVVKPRMAVQWRQKDAWQAVGARKAFLVRSAGGLCAEYARLASISPEVMIQEYVEGADCDIAVYCCFMDTQHEMQAYFTARKVRQSPSLFGTGCVVETISIPEIVSLARRLLQAVGYTGIAEVEFKHDASAGKWLLIEVNPRHWDQHEMGTHLGVNLSWIAYQDMIGCPSSRGPEAQPATPLKWIAETEALSLVLRNAYSQIHEKRRYFEVIGTTFKEVAFLLKGRKIFAILHWSDPLPGVLLCLRTARELCEMVARHLASHFRTCQAQSTPGHKADELSGT